MQRQPAQPTLKAVDNLESAFYQEHLQHQRAHQQPTAVWQHPAPPQPTPADLNLPEDDETFLDRLSVMLANRAGQFLSEPETLKQILKFSELQRDNRQLARHIQHLLTVIHEQKRALHSIQQQQQAALDDQYQHLFGQLYLKK